MMRAGLVSQNTPTKEPLKGNGGNLVTTYPPYAP